jgi:hypothetical protein
MPNAELNDRYHSAWQISAAGRSGPLDRIVVRLVDTNGAVYHVVAVFVFGKRPSVIGIN